MNYFRLEHGPITHTQHVSSSQRKHARIEFIGKPCSYNISYSLLLPTGRPMSCRHSDRLVSGYSTASKRLYDHAKRFINAVGIPTLN